MPYTITPVLMEQRIVILPVVQQLCSIIQLSVVTMTSSAFVLVCSANLSIVRQFVTSFRRLFCTPQQRSGPIKSIFAAYLANLFCPNCLKLYILYEYMDSIDQTPQYRYLEVLNGAQVDSRNLLLKYVRLKSHRHVEAFYSEDILLVRLVKVVFHRDPVFLKCESNG